MKSYSILFLLGVFLVVISLVAENEVTATPAPCGYGFPPHHRHHRKHDDDDDDDKRSKKDKPKDKDDDKKDKDDKKNKKDKKDKFKKMMEALMKEFEQLLALL